MVMMKGQGGCYSYICSMRKANKKRQLLPGRPMRRDATSSASSQDLQAARHPSSKDLQAARLPSSQDLQAARHPSLPWFTTPVLSAVQIFMLLGFLRAKKWLGNVSM